MAAPNAPACRSSASRKSIAIGSLVVASTSSRTEARTSWAGAFSLRRSASALKKWACSMYSSRPSGARAEVSAASLDMAGHALRGVGRRSVGIQIWGSGIRRRCGRRCRRLGLQGFSFENVVGELQRSLARTLIQCGRNVTGALHRVKLRLDAKVVKSLDHFLRAANLDELI